MDTKLDRIVADLIDRFELIAGDDTNYYMSLARGQCPYNERDEAKITERYLAWLGEAERSALVVDRAEQEGISVAGVHRLREAIQDARGIGTPDEVFFAGSRLAQLRNRAVADQESGRTRERKDPVGEPESLDPRVQQAVSRTTRADPGTGLPALTPIPD